MNEETADLTMAPEVIGAFSQLRQRSEHLVSEIGRLEVRKADILGEIHDLNTKATALLRQEGERLGIPAGTPFRVTPEGTVIVQEG